MGWKEEAISWFTEQWHQHHIGHGWKSGSINVTPIKWSTQGPRCMFTQRHFCNSKWSLFRDLAGRPKTLQLCLFKSKMESAILIRNHLQSRRSVRCSRWRIQANRPHVLHPCSHGDANIGGLQNTTYLILAGTQNLNYRTHSMLLLLVTTNSNCIWGALQFDEETKQLWVRLLIHSWLRYDEMDGEDSRSVHRYWRWGSWVPHATPPHAQMNPESPSASSSLVVFEPGMFTNVI